VATYCPRCGTPTPFATILLGRVHALCFMFAQIRSGKLQSYPHHFSDCPEPLKPNIICMYLFAYSYTQRPLNIHLFSFHTNIFLFMYIYILSRFIWIYFHIPIHINLFICISFHITYIYFRIHVVHVCMYTCIFIRICLPHHSVHLCFPTHMHRYFHTDVHISAFSYASVLPIHIHLSAYFYASIFQLSCAYTCLLIDS